MRRVLELLLSDQWDVQAVEDGRSALRMARTRPPDLAVVDLLIPQLDGLELLREMRADVRTRQVPVIMISGVTEEEPRIRALEAGANDFLVKPFSERELIVKMKAQLENAALRAAEAEADERQVQQRDRLLRAVLDGVAGVSADLKDRQGRYLVINSTGAAYLGRTVADVEGRRDRDMRPPGVADQAEAMDGEVLRSGEQRNFVLDDDVPGRGRHTFLMTKAPFRGEDGSIQGVVGVARDVTELQQAGHRATLLAEAGRILASTLDYEHTLASVAQLAVPSMADWCAVDVRAEDGGIRRLAAAGADPSPAESGRDGEPSGIARTMQTGRAELFAEGPQRWAMAAPLVARGRILGALSFGTGESRREYSPEDLAFAQSLADHAALAIDNARLYREAQDANRIKDDFLATLSHELRTPLNAIVGWAHLLRTGTLDAEAVRRAAETIDRNARIQSQLVGDVLDVSRIVAGKLRLESRPVELGAVLEAALDTVRASARAKGIGITANLDPAAGPVLGDVDRLQQVFWNLLSNAVKFTQEAGEIRIRLARVGTQVEAVVEDTGIGLSAEFLPHVFERFRQADGSSTRRHGGLGLGLSIARHLVELHGGTLSAASPGPGHGATFRVALPLMIGFEPAPNPPRAELHLSPPSIEGVRVLVVDDDADTRELLSTVLVRAGARVAAVPSAADALAAIERERPDVLLSDIEMPGQNGYELIRRLRERPAERGGRIAAAALTAYARPEDRLEALRAGFQFHMAKPVDPRELVMVVASLADRLRS
jgi:PAS domain S-box-containing protein